MWNSDGINRLCVIFFVDKKVNKKLEGRFYLLGFHAGFTVFSTFSRWIHRLFDLFLELRVFLRRCVFRRLRRFPPKFRSISISSLVYSFGFEVASILSNPTPNPTGFGSFDNKDVTFCFKSPKYFSHTGGRTRLSALKGPYPNR